MSAYQLSRRETWVLATLLSLPIQQGSVLGEWLGEGEVPTDGILQSWIPGSIKTLQEKEYYSTVKESSNEFIKCLMLAALGQKHIQVVLRTNNTAVTTRFLLAGSGAVQYGFYDDQIILHPANLFEDILPNLLPGWLAIRSSQNLELTMPQNSFFFFKQACYQRDVAVIMNADSSEVFLQRDLEHSFARDNDWVDVFQALGLKGIDPLDEISIPTQLNNLLAQKMLERVDNTGLTIGSKGIQLAESLTDPNLVAIIIGFSSLHPERLDTSLFLVGAGNLFRLDFKDAMVFISGMESRQDGVNWLRSFVHTD